MPKLQYKHEKGALHIGGGRIFFPGQPLPVSEEEKEELLARFSDDLEEVEEAEEKTVKRNRKSPKGEEITDADTSAAEKS
jgi:hypothetical protein